MGLKLRHFMSRPNATATKHGGANIVSSASPSRSIRASVPEWLPRVVVQSKRVCVSASSHGVRRSATNAEGYTGDGDRVEHVGDITGIFFLPKAGIKNDRTFTLVELPPRFSGDNVVGITVVRESVYSGNSFKQPQKSTSTFSMVNGSREPLMTRDGRSKPASFPATPLPPPMKTTPLTHSGLACANWKRRGWRR